jgi:hypothetical protein
MYISFRQSTTRREPVLECGRCGALVTDTALHTDWHRGFEEGSLETSSGHGSLETSSGHGAVLSEDQAVEHGLIPDPERTVPPTSSEVAREEERLRRITGRRDLRLYPFPAPVHAVPSVFMEAVYQLDLRDLSEERLDREGGPQPLTDPLTGHRRTPE